MFEAEADKLVKAGFDAPRWREGEPKPKVNMSALKRVKIIKRVGDVIHIDQPDLKAFGIDASKIEL